MGTVKKTLDKQFACIFDLDGSICSHRKEHFLVDLLVFDTNTMHLHRNINNIAFYSLRCFFLLHHSFDKLPIFFTAFGEHYLCESERFCVLNITFQCLK